VGEVKAEDLLAGLRLGESRVSCEAAVDGDVDSHCIPPLVGGSPYRRGCLGPRDPAEQRCKEAEEQILEGEAPA